MWFGVILGCTPPTGDTAAPEPTTPLLTPCPTEGDGALVAPGAGCVVFPPSDAGADPYGVNAAVWNYALAPDADRTGVLVLFLAPSLGSPSFSIATPEDNVYTAAAGVGDHVLALAYRNDQVLGLVCRDDDACYEPTRTALVTGEVSAEVPWLVSRNLLPSETIDFRTATALAHLAERWPGGGWDVYLDPAVDPAVDPGAAVRWDRVFVTGHSQGGGHAALIAKLRRVGRLVTLSSPCDEADGAPATWQTHDASWASDPAAVGWGFAAAIDPICPAHAAIWDALGLDAARRFDDVALCGGASSHTATTQCVANLGRVAALVTPRRRGAWRTGPGTTRPPRPTGRRRRGRRGT